ncbi:MAG: hypothetical protein ACMUIP_10445 [bacterium]
MNETIVDLAAIINIINYINKKNKNKTFTNYFKQGLNSTSFNTIWMQNTIAFLDKEGDFFRLYFYSKNLEELYEALNGLLIRPTVIDCVTNKFSINLHNVLLKSGFKKIALYKRLQNNNFPFYETNKSLLFAEKKELAFLYERLFTDFDKYLDHLPTMDKLIEYLQNDQVLVMREDSIISGYIIYRIQGKKVFLNYWFNKGNPLNSIRLLTNFYGLMNAKGVKSGFVWVSVEKKGVLKVHQTFGYNFDGLEDHIYLK